MENVRIHKYLADAGLMSRRSAEDAVKRGEVKINGVRAELGQKVDPENDTVEYKGKPVVQERVRYVYMMLNKPVGYVTTLSDEKGRPCVKDLLGDIEERVYPVGRLDLDSEGLLLLTNDGELANRLTHPVHEIPKIYSVTVKGRITYEQRKKLSHPMEIDGYKIRPVEHSILSMTEDKTTLRMELYEGRNRQIRKMCEQVGLEVLKLKRIAIGSIELGNIKPGQVRKLTRAQVDSLKTACKMPRRDG